MIRFMRLGAAKQTVYLRIVEAQLSQLPPEARELVKTALRRALLGSSERWTARVMAIAVQSLAQAQARLNASHASLKIRKGNSEYDET
jgi:hypothetical protein